MTNRRISLKSLALGSCAVSALIAGPAAAEQFAVEAQDLRPALQQFASQGDQQVLFSNEAVAGKRSAGFSGEASPEAALQKLLAGTGLTYRRNGDTFLVVSASDPQSGSAAGDGADAGTVQALVVTAQKREENIQDVPIAMSAFTQEDLTRSQVAGGPDLMTQVPNFTFTKTNFTGYSIQIRGIGTQAISATTDAAVAVAENNTSFIRNRFFEQEFYDLERVEVLRGPQGTLYGRNATAGVVNIITAKPKFAYQAKLSGDVGNYNSIRFEGMINLPLVDDKVAMRLAGAWTKRDGYDTNQLTGNQIDGRDLWSTRLSLRVRPTDRIDVNLIWEHFQEDDDRLRSGKQLCKRHLPAMIGGVTVPLDEMAPQDRGGNNGTYYSQYFSQGCEAASLYSPDSFQAPVGLRLPYYGSLWGLGLPIATVPEGLGYRWVDPYESTTQSRDLRVIESTVDPKYRAETDTVELQASIDLTDHLTLTSETGYLSDDVFSTEDYNRFSTRSGVFLGNAFGTHDQYVAAGVLDDNGVFCDPQLGCSDRLLVVDESTAKSRHFSQEFRLSTDFEGALNFSLGANFLRYDTQEKYYVFANTLTLTAIIQNLPNQVYTYTPGVSDNSNCQPQGFRVPDTSSFEEITWCVYTDPNTIGSLNDLGHNYFLSKNPYKLISYAAFGEAYYQIAENLKLTAGLRWTVDKKEAPRIPSWIFAANSVGYPVAAVVRQEWREPTGRLALDWKPDLGFTDETLVYASYARGYKAGGANPPPPGLVMRALVLVPPDFGPLAQQQAATMPRTFEPEFVNAYEIGTKNTLLDGGVTLNLAAFYYDYKGYQISQIVNRAAINLNFDAKVWGLEVEANWRPLENLAIGFKGGYEMTRMADGSRAIDMIDRTAGNPNWYVTGPFPTFASNCVLPTYTVVSPDGVIGVQGGPSGGLLSPCEDAYVLGRDPAQFFRYPGYPGFSAQDHPEVNGGAGFYKDLSGNELPNAPHFTATLTGDYTLPLPNDWLMTLHSDLYYQSEAWTRVFNTPGYDKLKAYTNVNLAAIFINDAAGWKAMAYVKNVLDHDSITGAFLNSDDTGLTTNVFLNEPRLYGLRVTKEFSGGPWWTGADPDHTGPYLLTVELGGQVQRFDAPNETVAPAFVSSFPAALDPTRPQHRDLDWGDGREVRITYKPQAASWSVMAGVRAGKTNGSTPLIHQQQPAGSAQCLVLIDGPLGGLCKPPFPIGVGVLKTGTDWSDSSAREKEEHLIADFAVGKDLGLGILDDSHSVVSAGLRYAKLESTTRATMNGIPDWNIPDGWAKYPSTRHQYSADITASRTFKGAGPTLSWDAAQKLLGSEQAGHLDLDWSVTGGILFGKQKATATGVEAENYSSIKYMVAATTARPPLTPQPLGIAPRDKSATVPVLDLSLGLSYEVQRIKLSTGYHWERYFNVLDAGYAEHKSYDRTIDGPYFKIAVGFGG
ncbi:MAG: TonB-dependent receptor domain-containing protein [Parcubacteria group bacterium]